MPNLLVRSRPSWLMGMLAGAAMPLAVLFASGSLRGPSSAWAAAAPPATAAPNQDQRIHELEERIRILELQQETQDRRLRLDIERNSRAFEEIDRRLRLLEDRTATQNEPATGPQPENAAALEALCRDPFIQAGHGIRRLKPGCEGAGNECDAPQAVDIRGVRKVLPACVQSAEKEHAVCDPPYFFDKGVKYVKPECM
jgi:hypothetical protein